MDVRIIVETTFDNGTTKTRRLGCLSRPFRRTQTEGLGLLLEDEDMLMGQLQTATLLDQFEAVREASRIGPDCDGVRAMHDLRSPVLDTLFGRFRVKAPRNGRCACNANPMSSRADRFHLSLSPFRIGRSRTCDAFGPNVRCVSSWGKWRVSWKP